MENHAGTVLSEVPTDLLSEFYINCEDGYEFNSQENGGCGGYNYEYFTDCYKQRVGLPILRIINIFVTALVTLII